MEKCPPSESPQTKWIIVLGHSRGHKMLFKLPQKQNLYDHSFSRHLIFFKANFGPFIRRYKKSQRPKLFVENRKLHLSYFCYKIPIKFSHFFSKIWKVKNISSIFSWFHLQLCDRFIMTPGTFETHNGHV